MYFLKFLWIKNLLENQPTRGIQLCNCFFSKHVMDLLKNAVVVNWSAAGQKWDWFEDKKLTVPDLSKIFTPINEKSFLFFPLSPVLTWIICDTG